MENAARWYIISLFGLTLIVVDNKHLFIGFPRLINGIPREFQMAIQVNDSSLVTSINAWFNRNLWEQADKEPPGRVGNSNPCSA